MARPCMPAGYVVSFFDDRTDEKVAAYVPMPSPPFPGMVVVPAGPTAAWEVTAVQVHLFDPDSWQAADGQPPYVDAMVKPGKGVHAGTVPPEEEPG